MGLGPTRDVKPVSAILRQFTDRQRAATEAVWSYDYVLYGGARGGGKSFWLRWVGVLLLLFLYYQRGLRGVRIGLFCDTYPDLVDRQISKIEAEFPSWLGSLHESRKHGLGFHLPAHLGGGVLALRNLDKPNKYKSAEFAALLVDQLEENKEDTFNILRGSKRWPGVAHTKFIASANPGGIGHNWVKRLWIDRDFPPYMQDLVGQFAFVPALPTDNPHLDEQYWTELRALPPDLSRAWVLGDWNVFAGQVFKQFRHDRHVVRPFEIPGWWPRWIAIDWGYAAPFCCLWFAQDPSTGRLFVYRELYVPGLVDRDQARLIRSSMMQAEERALRVRWADPSMWAAQTVEDRVTSTADVYAAEGVPLTKADNDRLAGKRRVDLALANLPDGWPALQIFETCVNLIRTLPALPYDETNVEDVDTEAEDHAYDALRMGLSDYRGQAPAEQSVELPAGVVAQQRVFASSRL